MARDQRRLAAIVSADVAGYSRLMGQDESGTLAALKAHRRELIDPKIAEYGGRIVKTTGDGLLLEFPSVVEAVRCAVEVQRGMAERNSAISTDQRIEFRVGINVGDIIIEGDDIYGDGVNVAARLEGIAEPGGICVSARVQEDVLGTLDVPLTDIGEQQLKNIQRPIRAYRVGLQGRRAAVSSLSATDRPSIAVLPFQNLSGDAQQDYFADGMVEDIITGLSRIKWLVVIARNSTFTYKGRVVDVKQVGRELGVRYVLEGSVRRMAGRVRITAQLINAENNAHIWAERYDQNLADIYDLQDELTLSVIGAIEPSLRLIESERVKRKRSDSLDAYDLVLRVQAHLLPMLKNVTEALTLLDSALLLDPKFALAHAYKAMCYHSRYLHSGLHEEDRLASLRHAQEAMLHGQDDALALTLAGFSIGMDGHDRGAAIAAFEAALAVSPSSALTYMLGSVMFGWGGIPERAVEWGERGIRLSPFDPWRASAFIGIALGHFQRGEFEESANAARKAVQSRPGFSIGYMLLSAPLVKLGRIAEAKGAAARALELQPDLRFNDQFKGVDCPPALASSLGESFRVAGLPE